MKKVLLTGHRGFIGSRLLPLLKEKGYDVVGYDLKNGDDIRDLKKLRYLFQKEEFDIVLHLAALAGVGAGEKDPGSYTSTNVVGTKNLLYLSELHRVKHFVFYSSSSVYGNGTPPAKEDAMLMPVSVYAMTKFVGEYLVRQSNTPHTIIRPFTVYGENGRKDLVVYKWLGQAKRGETIVVYGDGTSKRGYTYVGDLVEGTVKCLEIEEAKGETFNLGGGEIISINELRDIFVEELEIRYVHEELPDWDVKENWADISKAEKILGWKPSKFFTEKIKEIIRSEK